MANYEIVLKFSYTVEDVDNEDEAYEEALSMMKCDTHPEPFDWSSYHISDDEEEEDEDFGKSPLDCPPNVFLCPLCPKYNTEFCPHWADNYRKEEDEFYG